jgi:hypothetical protein
VDRALAHKPRLFGGARECEFGQARGGAHTDTPSVVRHEISHRSSPFIPDRAWTAR